MLDAALQRHEPWIIRLRNLHAQCLVEADDEVEDVHRIEIDLIAEGNVGLDGGEINLRRDLAEHAENCRPDLVPGHSRLGSWSRRSIAARKRPARWPSGTRGSAERVAGTRGRGA